MNIKKALIASVVLYAIMFLVASALIFKVSENVFGLIMLVLSAVLTFLIAKEYYFKGMTISRPLKEGLALGIVFVVVVFIIEIPVMVYGFASQQGWAYFTSWHIIAGYILMLVAPVAAAHKTKK